MTTLTMIRGDDRVLSVQATEDLAGADLKFTAKRFWYDADEDAVLSLSSGDGIELDTDTTVALITLAAADTRELDPVALSWDLEAVDGTGATHTLVSGRLVIGADVTRSLV